jgi:hypothetical protein
MELRANTMRRSEPGKKAVRTMAEYKIPDPVIYLEPVTSDEIAASKRIIKGNPKVNRKTVELVSNVFRDIEPIYNITPPKHKQSKTASAKKAGQKKK